MMKYVTRFVVVLLFALIAVSVHAKGGHGGHGGGHHSEGHAEGHPAERATPHEAPTPQHETAARPFVSRWWIFHQQRRQRCDNQQQTSPECRAREGAC